VVIGSWASPEGERGACRPTPHRTGPPAAAGEFEIVRPHHERLQQTHQTRTSNTALVLVNFSSRDRLATAGGSPPRGVRYAGVAFTVKEPLCPNRNTMSFLRP
jgi:hypothetical protein